MRDEIEDMHALADECREWRDRFEPRMDRTVPAVREVENEFNRLAKKLDEIAKRLADDFERYKTMLEEASQDIPGHTQRQRDLRDAIDELP